MDLSGRGHLTFSLLDRSNNNMNELLAILERRDSHSGIPVLVDVSAEGAQRAFTLNEILESARLLAAGWVHFGLESGESVILHTEPGIHWARHMLAVLLAGGCPVTVSPHSGEERIVKRADICRARFVVTSWPKGAGQAFLSALVERFDKVVYTQTPASGLAEAAGGAEGAVREKLVRADGLAQQGATLLDIDPGVLEARQTSMDGDNAAAVVFTAGTGGQARGIQLKVANLVAEIDALQARAPLKPGSVVLCGLGPQHVVGLVAFWWALAADATLVFKRSSYVSHRDHAPTVLVLSPLGLAELVKEGESSARGMAAKRLWKWALHRVEASRPGRDKLFKRLPSEVAGGVISRRLKELLGPQARRIICVGGLVPESQRKLLAASGMEVLIGYGTTETCGVSHLSVPGDRQVGTAGPPLDGVDAKFSPSGEILVRGPTVASKVWLEKRGLVDIDLPEGFFHTGDYGLSEDGRLIVTGARSDVVRTQKGDVPGSDIEALLATRPEIRRAVVVGQGRPHLAALLDVDADLLWHKTGGKGARPHDWRYWEDEKVEQHLRRMVAAVNRRLDKNEMVQRFAVVPGGFSEREEELDSSGRVVRHKVAKRHADLIDRLYRE